MPKDKVRGQQYTFEECTDTEREHLFSVGIQTLDAFRHMRRMQIDDEILCRVCISIEQKLGILAEED
jgi:hypothetical protein